MNIRTLALALLLVAAPAFGAGIDGKWTGSIAMADGPFQVNYVLKAQGTKLTGTTTGPNGSTLELKNGKIVGNKISFSLEVPGDSGPMTFNYTGVIAGGEIKIHSEFNGQPVDFSIRRATETAGP